ncbi:unnamed protein product [Paramecium octaurelia]|uniref:Uncharacterized protein n=1 Tax=Paramecium octaurelia TaxID=43137 RepID=A0A8S1WSH8_PAROT|nr:unnamed protein product [Paramecium octaurelia]
MFQIVHILEENQKLIGNYQSRNQLSFLFECSKWIYESLFLRCERCGIINALKTIELRDQLISATTA